MPRGRFVLAAVVLALAFATASGALIRPSRGDSERGFHFDSQAGTPAGSTGATATQILIMVGTGTFEVGGGEVDGGGVFQIITNTVTIPKPIVSFGTWEAASLVSYNEIGTYGAYASGTAMMEITLTLSDGTQIPATLTVVCNIGAAGLSTGAVEGIYVVEGGTSFTPVAGLTVFSTIGGD